MPISFSYGRSALHTHLAAVAQHDYEDKEIDFLKDRGCWFGNHAWFICQNARFYKRDTGFGKGGLQPPLALKHLRL